MNEPITDLEVLRDMFAVPGYTWVIDENGVPVLMCDDLDRACNTNEVWAADGKLRSPEPEWMDIRAAIAVGCAHLGLPPPWRTVELIAEELADADKDLAAVGEYEDCYGERLGAAMALGVADQIARGFR